MSTGIGAKPNAAGLYKGRPNDARWNDGSATMLWTGSPWQQIQGAFGCSRDTIAWVKRRLGPGVTGEA